MGPILTEASRNFLKTIFDHGAQNASSALSTWLGEEARLTVSDIELAELSAAINLLGPPETLVAACVMDLTGRLTGSILLVFEDCSGLALVDLLLRQPLGTTTNWNELEQSAAKETMNIVGCAYVNALAMHLPDSGDLIPTPPTFFHEFAGSLLEFALMEQAQESNQIVLVHSEFTAQGSAASLNWTLLFVPSQESLRELTDLLIV